MATKLCPKCLSSSLSGTSQTTVKCDSCGYLFDTSQAALFS